MSIFDTIRVRKPKRTNFDLSHEVKLSTNIGKLTPIFCQDVVPGDRFRMSSEVFIRLAPMIAPVMHQIDCYVHYFFVPYRLLWKNWEEFITGGEDGTSSPVFPRLNIAAASSAIKDKSYFGDGSLCDFLGVPNIDQLKDLDGLYTVSQLPFRAYQLIYNEYYRDQNLTEDFDVKELPDIIANSAAHHASGYVAKLLGMRYRAWEKDYFTSALPDPQRGPEVTLPLLGEADVVFKTSGSSSPVNSTQLRDDRGNLMPATSLSSGADGILKNQDRANVHIDNSNNLKVDLESATATTINDLRRAMKLQEWLEKNARSGARYVEQILAHFGVRSSDARLQRPEYLGGGVSKVQISDVVQTTQTSTEDGNLSASPQGNLSGYGISVGKSNRFKRFFEEHGIVMGIMSIRPRSAYMQGISRHLTKFDRFDYYFPEFAHLGEQEIKNRELYATGMATDDLTFGYTPRYAEYKFIPSSVHGEFRSSLDFWHLARRFATQPVLNESFVKVNPINNQRIFAVEDPSVDKFYCQIYNKVIAKRPMPRFGTPLF